jgi:membrane protein implicated in regulation of membrane protease activity
MVRYFYSWAPLFIVATIFFLALPWLGLIAVMVVALVALPTLALAIFVAPYMLVRALVRHWQHTTPEPTVRPAREPGFDSEVATQRLSVTAG